MLEMRYGGRDGALICLDEAEDRIIVRTRSKRPFERDRLPLASRRVLARFEEEIRFDDSGVCILRAARKSPRLRDQARAVLKHDPTLRFAGRVLRYADTDRAVAYTENLYVKLRPGVSPRVAHRLFADAGLQAKRRLGSARNAWLCAPRIEGIGRAVFHLAGALLADRRVEFCHPETAALAVRRAAAPEQWHLQPTALGGERIDKGHVDVAGAWEYTRGEGTTIAVIDDGVDVDHPEFRGRVVWQFNAIGNARDARHRRADEMHGTCCAGVAAAAGRRASGVAPKAKLLPIRSDAGLGTASEAECFTWAVNHGADVISCSWGPDEGEEMPLPDITREAIDDALKRGRNGRGTPIVWAAGNGGENIEPDGYASYDGVIAVGACDYRGRRCVYSDFGPSVFCVFPSGRDNDGTDHGIFTTDRRGRAGYNDRRADLGDPRGDYTNDFSGTSSATPGVAGVIALMLSVAPRLRIDDVKRLLKRACTKIDRSRANYVRGHSHRYGYGRVDAARAVKLAANFAGKASPVEGRR
jgi:subtilisin family serine protease